MSKFIIVFLTFCLLGTLVRAQNVYYVSSSGGSDNNSGTSTSSPWKTLSKLNSRTFAAGDRILLKKGDTWKEQLNISSIGTSSVRISFESYGTGNAPVISGADVISGFAQYSGNIWRVSKSTSVQQVFFNGVRGALVSSITDITSANKWFWSSGYLYVYSTANPGSAIQISNRQRGIYITGDYIDITGIQVEKTFGAAIELGSTALGVIIDGCTLYQWSVAINGSLGGITIYGSYNEIKNCTLGKNTGNDLADQGWSGLVGLAINGKNNIIDNNKIYHSAIENESRSGIYGVGIKIVSAQGTTKIFKNYIYHVGSHGVSATNSTVSGDQIHIYENTIEHPGQSGISAYQTRGADGVGGKGYVYNNNVSFSNRLGGDIGAAGTQSSGIHFNDGLRGTTDPARPFMKWYCYENVIHDNQSLKVPNSPDACGVSMDYNANNVEVYKNLIYNNYSKGIEMWNANNCKVYYNIIYGNDAGINVTCQSGGVESANNNQIYNNTCFKNYNGLEKGPNLHTEIFFGLRGKYNIIKNNILYASADGYAYVYNVDNTFGHELDYNVVFTEGTYVARDGLYGKLTYANWRLKRATWDVHSVNANPQFNSSTTGDFSLKSTSPAINKGTSLGLLVDYLGKTSSGTPDIGALEYGSTATTPPPPAGTKLVFNAMQGTLSGDARLGSMTGSRNSRVAYFQGTNGGVNFNVNIPVSGKTWYVWARMYCMSSGGKNAFSLNIKGTSYILGDNDNKYNQWYWDGYKGAVINVGTLNAGNNAFSISGRESGLTLWVDQVVFTDDPNLIATDNTIPFSSSTTPTVLTYNAMSGNLSGDARLGSMTGAKNSRTVYYTGTNGGATFSVNIPAAGKTWYAWARMYYMSSGGKNSFFLKTNGQSFILGDGNTWDRWIWDGTGGGKITLGTFPAGNNILVISGREPGLTLWVDQFIITDDPNYNPTSLGKDASEEESAETADAQLPNEFQLTQNFPNPFNPSTSIRFSVPEVSNVVLKIYDILGAEVETLVDEMKSPGYYEINFDGGNLASGIYIYQLRAKNFVQTRKMNLLK